LLVVLEIAQRARTIDLGGQQRRIHIDPGLAQVDRSLLAALDAFQHVRDPLVIVERGKRIQQPPFLEAGGFVGEFEFLRGFLRADESFASISRFFDSRFWVTRLLDGRAVAFQIVEFIVQFVQVLRVHVCIHCC
jgi:hypothetical protein